MKIERYTKEERAALLGTISGQRKRIAELEAIIAGDPPAGVADYLRMHREFIDLIDKYAKIIVELKAANATLREQLKMQIEDQEANK